MRIFLSFSVELISLPRYVNASTDSIDSPETVCIEPCWLKLMKLVLEVHSKVKYLLFSLGSSNSGTTFHGGDGGGNDLFSSFEVNKMSEIPFRTKCLKHFLSLIVATTKTPAPFFIVHN